MSQKFHADIYISLKESVLDPQGQVVKNALENLSFEEITDVRIGKWIQLNVEADNLATAKTIADNVCDKLLVNKVIEAYHLQIQEIK